MVENIPSETVLRLTAQIVSAHVEHNSVQADALPGLIERVYQTLRGVGQAPVEVEKPAPAVPIKQSVRPDFIVCLEDGKKLKMLKRHLMTSYKLTPEQYRTRWGLSSDYPMVAPNYAKVRSSLAKKIGLGRKASATPGRPTAKLAANRRGRPALRGKRARTG
ncbi:MAG TPA: MucR family transcriptional regulator [Acetobacteraceae bacterium]|nr:MucR family transcriptional regulator [Acetobacteraceae bacterium]